MNTTQTSNEPSRAGHLAWCKQRAFQYCDAGDSDQAFASMASDLGRHPETENHSGVKVGILLLASGGLNGCKEMRKFIEGFN